MIGQMMLVNGLIKGAGSQREAARRLNITECLMSKIKACERNLAPDLMPKASRMHPLAGLGIALITTGYRIFEYITGDRHHQTMIRKAEKEDAEADAALKRIAILLLDANGPEDLTEEVREEAALLLNEVLDRINMDFNTVIEIDDRFRLGIMEYLVGGKEKTTQRRVAV